MTTPTAEQAVALELFGTGVPLAIEAGAGTGKTTTLRMLAEQTRKAGTYVAFNKAIVEDARGSMPRNVTSSTAHSLAYRSTITPERKRRMKQGRMRSTDLARALGMERAYITVRKADSSKVLQPSFLASQVLAAIARFCQSADPAPAAHHVPYIEGIDEPGSDGQRTFENNRIVRQQLVPFMAKAWADITADDGRLTFGHDHYLKLWELSDPVIPGDFLLFDEAQDAAPVMLSAVEQQRSSQLVFVGDSQQQIYEWRGAVNALANVAAEARAYLSESFRFGPPIAAVANDLLDILGAELRLTGRGGPSTVAPLDTPLAILTRTNAHAVERVMQLQRAGRKPHLVGGGREVVWFAEAAAALMRGQRTEHPELACFESWGEVQTYVENDPLGGELKLLVGLVDEFGVDAIVASLKHMPTEPNADVIVSTAHKSKGREWATVQLAADFQTPDLDAFGEWRLLYVAATRARATLDISLCEPLSDLAGSPTLAVT